MKTREAPHTREEQGVASWENLGVRSQKVVPGPGTPQEAQRRRSGMAPTAPGGLSVLLSGRQVSHPVRSHKTHKTLAAGLLGAQAPRSGGKETS